MTSWLVLIGSSVVLMELLLKHHSAGKKIGKNPVDRAKIGTKRSLCTDGSGIPLGCTIAGANKNDFKILKETLTSLFITPPVSKKKKGLCLDKGYDYSEVRILLKELSYTEHIRSRGEEIQEKKKGYKPRRWPVERTHSWMNRFRGILIRWSKKAENFLGQIHLVCSYIIMGRCGLLG